MNSRSLAETGNQAESPGQARTKGSTKKATVEGQSGAPEGLLLSWHVCQRGAVGGCPGSRLIAREKQVHGWIELQCCMARFG